MAIKHWLAKHKPKSVGQMRTVSEALSRDFKMVKGLRSKELRYAYCDVKKAGLYGTGDQPDLTWMPLRVVPRGSGGAGLSEWPVTHAAFALCVRFRFGKPQCDECKGCPLTAVRGVPCTARQVGQKLSPWESMQDGDPSPLLALMRTAIETRKNNRVREERKEDNDAD